MEWELNTSRSRNNQEIAQEILQIYTESLHDHNNLRNILSEYSILDYFGKCFYGQDEVCSHLIANLYDSSFKLFTLTTDEKKSSIDWDIFSEMKDCKAEEELGVSLISTPTTSFPSLAFSTPLRASSNKKKCKNLSGKRSPLNFVPDHFFNTKKFKLDYKFNDGKFVLESPSENLNDKFSPAIFHNVIPTDMRFLSSFGTICYSKKILSTSDPKRVKHHSNGTPRDRFCHLYIGFQCNEHFINVTNCKIWIIRYEISSKINPRNLLKAFNEVDLD